MGDAAFGTNLPFRRAEKAMKRRQDTPSLDLLPL